MKCNVFFAMLIGPRSKQEDCLINGSDLFQEDRLTQKSEFNADKLLLTICDGMGGHENGDTASHFTCEQLLSIYKQNKFSADTVNSNLKTIQQSAAKDLPENCGTTVAGLFISGNKALAFNAGDSRVYKLTPNEIVYISHDHSLVQDLLDKSFIQKEAAFEHPFRNLVEFGIGPAFINAWQDTDIYTYEETVSLDSWYLICSDGLSDLMTDSEIYNSLMPDPLQNGDKLLKKLNKQGLKDNTSVIIVKFD